MAQTTPAKQLRQNALLIVFQAMHWCSLTAQKAQRKNKRQIPES
jgi:hypothetical protein